VAFIRLDFPPRQRDTAQTIASLFAGFIGRPIARLRPEHTLVEILSWSESDSFDAVEFIMALEEEFGFKIDDDFAARFEQRTFRDFVEYVSRTAVAVAIGASCGHRR
jgi:acyl carrier protein